MALLINVAAFAYFTYREQGAIQNKPVLPALNAERIQVLKADATGGSQPDAFGDKLTCWRWSGFKPEALIRARAALDPLSLGEVVTQAANEEYWVYIAPLKNKRDGEKKLVELKALAIEDGVLVEERGKWQFAISLAVFSSEDAAIIRLNQLKEKGVKSAKILKREVAEGTLLIQRANEKIVNTLNKLRADFPETTFSPTECKAL